MLVKNGRMGDNLENIIGLVWDLNEDTAAPNINLNVFGKKNGKSNGPKLFDTDLDLLKPDKPYLVSHRNCMMY